ncbi:MAG: metallophosphoesterase family protein [Phycisphaerae bacterium]|nr:metallophosphoesterase family protein [Phycisphaerae bacterium]
MASPPSPPAPATTPATAIISDIHGNVEALTAVLADIDARGLQRVICLGDIIGYGPDPLACIDLVRTRCQWSLMGNHDFGVLYEPTNFNPGAESAAFWTRNRLDSEPDDAHRRERYEFLGRLRVRIVEAGPDARVQVLFVHGSPRRPINEYIFPDDVRTAPDKLTTIFDRVPRICFVGHTHVPGVFTSEPDFYPPGELTDAVYKITDDEKAIVNVGSVGQPRDLDPRASYVILEPLGGDGTGRAAGANGNGGSGGGGGGAQVRFVRVPYDIDACAGKIKAIPQLSDWLADRLYEGR